VTATHALDAPARTGRPRSRAANDAILAATLDLLREHGYGGLTMSAVIERAGVSSATLYRRWATKQDLVLAALESMRPEPTSTDTGSLAGDLRAFLRRTSGAIDRGWVEVSEAVGVEAKRNAELFDALYERFVHPKLEELSGILDRAKQRGELSAVPAPEVALSLVIGPVHYHAVVLSRPLTESFLRKAADHAVAG
jgi:AcrR family transcriptional regulator